MGTPSIVGNQMVKYHCLGASDADADDEQVQRAHRYLCCTLSARDTPERPGCHRCKQVQCRAQNKNLGQAIGLATLMGAMDGQLVERLTQSMLPVIGMEATDCISGRK